MFRAMFACMQKSANRQEIGQLNENKIGLLRAALLMARHWGWSVWRPAIDATVHLLRAGEAAARQGKAGFLALKQCLSSAERKFAGQNTGGNRRPPPSEAHRVRTRLVRPCLPSGHLDSIMLSSSGDARTELAEAAKGRALWASCLPPPPPPPPAAEPTAEVRHCLCTVFPLPSRLRLCLSLRSLGSARPGGRQRRSRLGSGSGGGSSAVGDGVGGGSRPVRARVEGGREPTLHRQGVPGLHRIAIVRWGRARRKALF